MKHGLIYRYVKTLNNVSLSQYIRYINRIQGIGFNMSLFSVSQSRAEWGSYYKTYIQHIHTCNPWKSGKIKNPVAKKYLSHYGIDLYTQLVRLRDSKNKRPFSVCSTVLKQLVQYFRLQYSCSIFLVYMINPDFFF